MLVGLAMAAALAPIASRPADAAGDPPVIASVPVLIPFQGFLTNASGVPLNGSFSLTFNIATGPSGGTILWTETLPAVPVTNGVFSVSLGSPTPFPAGLFDSGARFVGVSVNGEPEMLPRSVLRSTPYALRASSADSLTGDVAIRIGARAAITTQTSGNSKIMLFHDLGLDSLASPGPPAVSMGIGSTGGGFQVLENAAGGGTVLIDGEDGTGSGFLQLLSDSNLVQFAPGFTGDVSALLPINSIARAEILDETGVASANNTNFVTLSSPTPASVISRTLIPPVDGHVLALGQSVARITHTTGTVTSGAVGLSDDGVNFGTAQDLNVILSGNAPSGSYAIPAHVNGVFLVSGGVPATVHIMATEVTGDIQLEDLSLTLLFIPTSYGTVTPTLIVPGRGGGEDAGSVRGPQTASEIAAERLGSEHWNQERIERELAAMRAYRAETSARLASLERQMAVNAR